MVILITGASHVGKTLLAQRLLERYGIPYLSEDHLKMGLIRSGYTSLTPEDDGELTEYLWPVVREMIKTAIENGQSLTVEGCYVPFYWRRDLDERYLAHIKFICLAMTEGYIDAHFAEIAAHESEIEKRFVDTDCTPEKLKEDNRRYADGFSRAGERVTLIDSDFEETIRSVCLSLCDQ
ncbi:MAG: adenylate kinase [Oscillospiraceae bacterium]|nr:adenylate kinase [Oscillospiraceae bacterium]